MVIMSDLAEAGLWLSCPSDGLLARASFETDDFRSVEAPDPVEATDPLLCEDVTDVDAVFAPGVWISEIVKPQCDAAGPTNLKTKFLELEGCS